MPKAIWIFLFLAEEEARILKALELSYKEVYDLEEML